METTSSIVRALRIRRGHARLAVSIAGLLLLGSCAEMPISPSVTVLPDHHKPFDVFMQDDGLCRGWASHSIGLPGHDAATQQMLRSTAEAAVFGALAGGLLGGNRGAAAGAAMGAMVGASAGATLRARTAANAQRRYDIAYRQCMHAKGNFVSGTAYPSYGWPVPAAVPAPPPPRSQAGARAVKQDHSGRPPSAWAIPVGPAVFEPVPSSGPA